VKVLPNYQSGFDTKRRVYVEAGRLNGATELKLNVKEEVKE